MNCSCYKPKLGVVLLTLALLAPDPVAARESPIVAVFDVVDKGARLSKRLRTRFNEFLAASVAVAGFRVVPRDQMLQRVRRQKKASYKKCYSQACQVEIGKELAAQQTLNTSIIRLGKKCVVTAVLFDLRTATSVGGASHEDSCTEVGLMRSVKETVAKLSGRRAATTPTGSGGLLVRSSPAGANAWIDGVAQKGVTPLTLKGLAPGEHLLELRVGNRLRHISKVVVATGRITSVRPVLQRVRLAIKVVSTPTDALIVVDGKEVGRTPSWVGPLAATKHTVELRKKGYVSSRRQLWVGLDREQLLEVTLQRSAVLTVHSSPAGASLYLDQQLVGRTPTTLTVAAGKRQMRLELAGRKPARRTVVLTAGGRQAVTMKLEPTAQARRHRVLQQQRQRTLTVDLQTRDRHRTKSSWAHWTLGAAGAFALGAIITYGVGIPRGNEAHQGYVDNPTDQEAMDRYRADVESAEKVVVVGHVLTGLSVAALAWSIYHFATRPALPETQTPPTSALRVTTGPGHGLNMEYRF